MSIKVVKNTENVFKKGRFQWHKLQFGNTWKIDNYFVMELMRFVNFGTITPYNLKTKFVATTLEKLNQGKNIRN